MPDSTSDPRFTVLMMEAQRAVVALDGLTHRDGHKASTAAIEDARRVCTALQSHQQTARMTKSQASLVQTALDLLQARLKFLGESV